MFVKKRQKRDVLTGVDIGTSTIKVVMGEFLPDGTLTVLGTGEAPSMKVAKGEITDLGLVREQLEKALIAAEQASGEDIGDIFLAVSGGHIHSANSVGSTPVHSPDRRVTEDDIIAAISNARGFTLSPSQKVIHSLDCAYKLDDNRDIARPLGLRSSRLDAEVHIVYGQRNRLDTPCELLTDVMGYPPTDIAFSGVAAAMAAFSPEEAENGALLIDIGAGVTEYVLYHTPGYLRTGQITVGCEHIINDLSIGLQLPVARCRQLLKDFSQIGSAVMNPDGRSRVVEVELTGKGVRRIPSSTIERIIELRLQELFEVISTDLRKHNMLERIGSGVALSGGGSRINGINMLASQIFSIPVRIGRPKLVNAKQDILSNPGYLTPLGLLHWGRHSMIVADAPNHSMFSMLKMDLARLRDALTGAFKW